MMFERDEYPYGLKLRSDLSVTAKAVIGAIYQKEHRKFVAEGVDYLLEQFHRIASNSSLDKQEQEQTMMDISESVFEAAAAEPDPEVKQHYINRIFYTASTCRQNDIAARVDQKAQTSGFVSPSVDCALALN